MFVPGGTLPSAGTLFGQNTPAEDFAQLTGSTGTSAIFGDAQRTKLDNILTGFNHQKILDAIYGTATQNSTPGGALGALEELAKQDKDYMELYLTMLRDKESQDEARKWYEEFNNTYYQRTAKDLEAAGMNPWLALTQGFGAGNGSISAAGSGQGGVTSAKAGKQQAGLSAASKMFGSIFAIIGAMLLAL